ncbi:MAG: hypothetical protein U0984_10365 [Prosthecobacter sp.]|nr:hypothetical protein [Prosthecobacter sp.]
MKSLGFTLVFMTAWAVKAADPAAHTVIVPYDVAKPLDGQKADRYYLPYDAFQKLWQAAKENRRTPKANEDPSQDARILAAVYRGRIEEQSLILEARLQVMSRGEWTPLRLPFEAKVGDAVTPALVGEVRIDGKASARVEDCILLEKPGSHLIELTATLPRPKNWRQAALLLPTAMAGALSVEGPRSEGWLRINGSAAMTAEDRPETRVFTAALGYHNSLDLRRTTRGLDRGEEAVPTAAVTMRVILRELLPDRVEARLQFDFPGAARRSLSYTVDEGVILTASNVYTMIAGARVRVTTDQLDMRRENGRVHVTLRLRHEVSDGAWLEFSGLRSAAANQTPLFLPEATRTQQQVSVLHEEGMEVKVQPGAGQLRLGGENAGQLRSAGTFKLGGAERLSYELKPAADLDEASVDYVFQLSEQKSELLAALALKRKQGVWTRARIGLPPNYEVQSINGPALKQWQHVGGELFLHFDPATAGKDARVIVHLARTMDQAVTSWKIEPLRPIGFAKQTGRGVIAAHAAMQVRLPDFARRTDIQEIDPTALDSVFAIAPPFEKKRGLRLEGLGWGADVTLTRQPARFSADAIALVLVSDAGIRVSQQVAAIVEQGALRQVSVRLPASLPEAAVSGPLLREMRTRVEGSERVYDCSFQTDVLDRAELTFDHDLPLTATLAVPLVKIADAQRLQRYFVLDNASAREAKVSDSAGLETVAREVLPYLPEGLARPQFYRATSDASRLTVAYTELTSTEANAALVTLADITTVLRADGERWDTVVYSLVNRSLQFLPVILPDGADLISVSVSGEAVRADEEVKDGRRVRLIPLIHTKPGQRALAVRLVWRFPPRDWSQARLDDPELVGLSAERTGWTVWTPPGYDLKDFDGNMEEIDVEGKDLQKLEGMLSELGEVNRELASGKLEYREAKDAYSSANRLAEQISVTKQEVLEKSQRLAGRLLSKESAPEKPTERRKVKELDKDVAKQRELLEGNWKGYAEKKSRADAPAAGKPAAKPGAKTDWSLNKTGDGKLELKGSNTFTGSVVDQKGAQVVNDNVAVNNGFFNDTRASSVTSGAVVMGGTLSVAGTGTVTLSGTNTYTGATTLNSQAQGITNIGANALASNARANNLSNAAPPPPPMKEQLMLKQLGDDMKDRQVGQTTTVGNLALPTVRQEELRKGGMLLPPVSAAESRPMAGAVAAAPAMGADPFAAPAAAPMSPPVQPGRAGTADPLAAGPNVKEGDERRVLDRDSEAAGIAAQTLESLRPTGRRSLALEVPLEGEPRHFSKLKDHAVLELHITRPWEPRQTRSAWVLGLGLVALAGSSRLKRLVGRRNPH